jgi:hypothetical protein
MADVSAYDLANAPGITSEDLQGYGSLGASVDPVSPFGNLSTGDVLGLGALGAGAGLMLGRGETPLPPEYAQMGAMVPGLQANAADLYGKGQDIYKMGLSDIQKARAGELTLPQQAELNQYKTGLQNTANQTMAAMGRSMTGDTSAIGISADIDAKILAMSQREIEFTLKTGFQELTAGQAEFGQSLGYSDAAAKILQAEGEAQLKQDQAYSKSLTDMFSTIGKIAGIAIGGSFGGPAGAAVGGQIGSMA